ncbi:MAG: tRNA guanosine(34) transglycosylase Tgt [Candidatus Methylacidiphilales bacterium]
MRFEVLAEDPASGARLGRLETGRGVVETPAFMPVGTQATVKCVDPDELRALRAQIILSNTYHLFVRPGLEVIRALGGLHRFMAWEGPILTDSGGFQVFSLAKLRTIREDGVAFQSHLDGTPLFIGPKEAVEIQYALGSDIMMAFDECPPWPAEQAMVAAAVDRTIRWARRCGEVLVSLPTGVTPDQALFGIVQGGSYPEERERCAKALVAMDFPGYAIGGVSVGEPEPEMLGAIRATVPHLPRDKPRYAMGLGQPDQMVKMIGLGVDMFDCVLPTRIARNGTAYTRRGTVALKNAGNRLDCGPIEEGCRCYACQRFSRAYIRHLIKSEEILGLRLVTLHNLHFYIDLMAQAREAIRRGTFAEWSGRFLSEYRTRED